MSRTPSRKEGHHKTIIYSRHRRILCGVQNAQAPFVWMQGILWIAPHSKITIVRDNGLCLNCLRPGHFANQCSSAQECKKCEKPHHSWLHITTQDKEAKVSDTALPRKDNPGDVVTTHTSQSSSSRQVSLMTCQVQVTSPDGHTTKARALLDSASSASFITEHLAQHFHLPRLHHNMKISGIGGASTKSPSRSMVDFKITPLGIEGKTLDVEALVLP